MNKNPNPAPPPPLMSSVALRGALDSCPPVWTVPFVRSGKLRLGVPNTGKLRELVGILVEEVYGCKRITKQLFFDAGEDLEVVRARSVDLPHLVARGLVDIGITGCDYVFESGEDLAEIEDLALITGQICLLNRSGEVPRQTEGSPLRISTQYPRHAALFRETAGLTAEIFAVSGAGELYPQFGLSDASVDCVVTGETCRQNGLQIAATIRPVTTGAYVRSRDTALPVLESYRAILGKLVSALNAIGLEALRERAETLPPP